MKNDKLNLCLHIKLNAPPVEQFDPANTTKIWMKVKRDEVFLRIDVKWGCAFKLNSKTS
eukprot:TRINITY_DN4760_c0_g1_i2.p1 TRINITY_DN4760_c0_g1~~TRINITY_DN4760_c0_g1_i2.p1  ORF type:complete len:59 (-),score=4.16 TRINITY_DN4760_c0_g1_i2:90-266(-)